jgi:predicted Fe-Mo cluster-binding NifX family protein
MLKNDGITVYQSDKKTVGEVVEQIKNNDLKEIDPRTACKGHGQRQGLIHGAGTGCGQVLGRRPGTGPNKRK